MIIKIVKMTTFEELSKVNQDLEYWLSRPPHERLEAAEMLRRQVDGSSSRLQRVARVIQRTKG